MGDKTYARDDHSMQHLKVVTLGAVVDLPSKLIKAEHQYQFLGRLDVLGRANLRTFGGNIDSAVTSIDGAGHHLDIRRFPATWTRKQF